PTAPLSQPPAAVATTFAVAELFPSVRGCLAVKNDNRESARSSWPSILFSSTSSPLELQASLWASSLNCLHLRLRLRLCLCLSRCGLTNRSAVGWIPPSLVNLLDLKELIKYKGLVVSICLVGALIGSLFSGWIADAVEHCRVFRLCALPMIIGALIRRQDLTEGLKNLQSKTLIFA
ncbi:hypothetical protein S83_060183, partial [Arachis hypogaea]